MTEVTTNISDKNSETLLIVEDQTFEALLSVVLDLLKNENVKTVTVKNKYIEHITFQARSGVMPSGVYQIYGNFNLETFKNERT